MERKPTNNFLQPPETHTPLIELKDFMKSALNEYDGGKKPTVDINSSTHWKKLETTVPPSKG